MRDIVRGSILEEEYPVFLKSVFGGEEATESDIEQFRVFLHALQIHHQRNERYRDVWKATGWRGAVFDIFKKARRIFQQYWGELKSDPNLGDEKTQIDDALDLINFSAFFIRGWREANEWGDR